MTKVFISYSRKDKEFAQKLAFAMTNLDIDTWVDWDDIPPTADWWTQIETGIEESDAFLFLLSPDSSVSQVCGREIEHAVKNNKRMLPLVVRDVDARQVNAALSHLNWIFFREQDNFDESLQRLKTAIETDLEWVEFHKRLQVRALEWERRKSKSLLLRGENLREAEEELAGVQQKRPRPTDLQRQFVLQSRKNETRNRNIVMTSASIAAILLGVAAVVAVIQSINATQQAELATERQHTAEIAQATAVAAKNEAEAARQEAVTQQQIVFASRLGAESLETEIGKSSEKLLLAIEALRASKGLPNPPVEAEQAMWAALKDMGGVPTFTNEETFDKMFFTDNEHFVSVSFSKILFWEISDSKISSTELAGLHKDDYIAPSASAVSPDFRWFVAAVNTAIYVWDLQAIGELPTRLEFYPDSIAFSRDSQQLVAGSWVDVEYQYWVWTVGEWNAAPKILETNDMSNPEISQSVILSKEDASELLLLKAGGLPISSIAGVSSFLIPVTGGGGSVNAFIKFSQNDQFFATTSLWSVFVWDRSNLSAPVKTLTYEESPNEISVNDQWMANLYTPYDGEPTLIFSGYTDPGAAPIFRRLEGRRIDGNINPVTDSKGRWLALATEPVVSLPNTTDYPGAIAVINFQDPLDPSFYFVGPHSTQITAMAFSPTDNWLASGDANGDIYLSSFGDQGYSGETRRLRGHDGWITDLAFSPNGNTLISKDQSGVLRLWDISSGANQIAIWPSAITFSDKAVTASQFGPSNLAFATGFDNGLVALWNVADINSPPMLFEGLSSNIQMVTLGPLGKWLVGGSSKGEVLIWSIDQKQEPIRLDMGAGIYEMVVSADEKWLYTVGDDGVQRWAMAYPAEPLFLNSPGVKKIMDIQLSSDGRWLAGYEPDRPSLVLWDVQQPHFDQRPSPVRTFSGVLRYTFSEDSLWLAYSNGIKVFLMDLAEPLGAQIILDIYQGSEFYASGLAISPDGQSVAISNGSVISLWTDLATSQQPLLLSNSNLYGNIILHFTNDRRWLIAYGNDRVMIWNADNFYATPIILERPRGVNDMAFSPDGRWMSILDNSGVVTLWALDPEKRLDLACQVVGRNFTRLEWLAYFPDKPYRESCPQWPIELEAMTDIAP